MQGRTHRRSLPEDWWWHTQQAMSVLSSTLPVRARSQIKLGSFTKNELGLGWKGEK